MKGSSKRKGGDGILWERKTWGKNLRVRYAPGIHKGERRMGKKYAEESEKNMRGD